MALKKAIKEIGKPLAKLGKPLRKMAILGSVLTPDLLPHARMVLC